MDIAQKRAQLIEFRSSLARTEQELQEALAALATNRDTIPRIERSLARAQAAEDFAREAVDTQNLERSRQLSIELTEIIRQKERFIAELQTGIQILEEDIASQTSINQAPVTSSGDVVQQDQTARDEAATTQTPEGQFIYDDDGELLPADSEEGKATNAEQFNDEFEFDNASSGFSVGPAKLPAGTTNGDPASAQPTDSGAPARAQALDTQVDNPETPDLLYKATMVTSKFSRGRFTQDIEGVLLGLTPSSPSLNGTVTQETLAAQARVRAASATDPLGTATVQALNAGGVGALVPQGVPLNASALKNIAMSRLPTTGSFANIVDQAGTLAQGIPASLPQINGLPTSSGQVIGSSVTARDIAEAASINAEGGDITADQVASNRALNDALTPAVFRQPRVARET